MPVLENSGLRMSAFDSLLADALGNAKGEEGFKVTGVSAKHGRAVVQLRDWLYCLVTTPGTQVRKRFVDRTGKTHVEFIDTVEMAAENAKEPRGLAPDSLTKSTVVPAVVKMLDAAERMAREFKKPAINDAILTLALFEVCDKDFRELVKYWDEQLDTFLRQLKDSQTLTDGGAAPEPFDAKSGKLVSSLFEPSGKRFCQRMFEDASSMGARKITTRHMLYTLLSAENGMLSVALIVRGIDVKKDMHTQLTRELMNPGAKRSERTDLTRDFVHDPVNSVLKQALVQARERGSKKIAEADIHRAFAATEMKELSRLMPRDKALDGNALKEYMNSSEVPPEDDGKGVKRLPIGEIAKKVKERICGQEAAVDRVLPWIKRLRYGLPRDGRPAAVVLFLGPTGAGKTQLAKELARYVFGDENQMLFLEMGQYKTKESMSGFIGAPPGYIGYGEGKLTNGLRDKPECVVLFDEIEKADTSVFDVLLRFCDEGVISDPAGPVRDGRKCVIVLTTNAGQNWMREHFKAHPEARNTDRDKLAQQLFDEARAELLQKGFRPEFLGRLDERISFLPFTLATCRDIVDGVLTRELEKFAKMKNVFIEVCNDARDFMAQRAYDKSIDEGARGAPRAVNEFIVTPAIDVLSDAEQNASIAEWEREKAQHAGDDESAEYVAADDEEEVSEQPPAPADDVNLIAYCIGIGEHETIILRSVDAVTLAQAAEATLSRGVAGIAQSRNITLEVARGVCDELVKKVLQVPAGERAKALDDGVVEIFKKIQAEGYPPEGGILLARGVRPRNTETVQFMVDETLMRRLAAVPGLSIKLDESARAVLAKAALEQAGEGAVAPAVDVLVDARVVAPGTAKLAEKRAGGSKAVNLTAIVMGISDIVLDEE